MTELGQKHSQAVIERVEGCIGSCKATDCAFNETEACRGGQVVIGEGRDPVCCKYSDSEEGKIFGSPGVVMVCRIADCSHNENGRCANPAPVDIGCKWGISCMSYRSV